MPGRRSDKQRTPVGTVPSGGSSGIQKRLIAGSCDGADGERVCRRGREQRRVDSWRGDPGKSASGTVVSGGISKGDSESAESYNSKTSRL